MLYLNIDIALAFSIANLKDKGRNLQYHLKVCFDCKKTEKIQYQIFRPVLIVQHPH
jgi:hypothetical protein